MDGVAVRARLQAHLTCESIVNPLRALTLRLRKRGFPKTVSLGSNWQKGQYLLTLISIVTLVGTAEMRRYIDSGGRVHHQPPSSRRRILGFSVLHASKNTRLRSDTRREEKARGWIVLA